jgi:hypothetical protein
MPFEVFDLDISVPENRDALLESYAFFRRHNMEYSETYDEPGLYKPWIEQSPEEAVDFLKFCNDHDDPELRRFGANLAVDFFEFTPDLAVELIETRMKDPDPMVRLDITRYIYDILIDPAQDLNQTIGILRTAKLIRAYKAAKVGETLSNNSRV